MSRVAAKAKKALVVAPFAVCLGFAVARALVADAAPPTGSISATCVETIPSGATRPEMTEKFPDEAISGYAANLELVIKHGKGETVFPNGFKVQAGSEALRSLEKQGFAIPDVDGGSGPKMETKVDHDSATTTVTLPILILPPAPGRVSMTLPPLPITVSRANNDIMTICTQPHDVLAEDPVANETDPQVKANPPGRHQREDWPFLRNLSLAVLGGLILGAIAGYFLLRQLRKPKPVKEVPKRVPWVVALEELEALRQSSLLVDGKKPEYFDAVSDCVRKYLGARYGFEGLGFDGLDTTTDEMRALLRRVKPPIKNIEDIGLFLSDCDLVKFARLVPTEDDCLATIDKGDAIVRATMPIATAQATAAKVGAAEPGKPPNATPPPPPATPTPPPPPPAPPPAAPPPTVSP